MKKPFFIGLPVLLLVFGFLFAGCDSGDGSRDLPISTTQWEMGRDGFYQFSTNDPQYYNYSFLRFLGHDSDTYEIECKKMSGNPDYAYGLIFGAANNNTDQYFLLWITCNGAYRIVKQNGATATYITDWARSGTVLTGYNRTNTLKVTKSGTSYTVFINNNQIDQFTDSSQFGQRIGFYASAGKEEDESFPNKPVDVRFRIK